MPEVVVQDGGFHCQRGGDQIVRSRCYEKTQREQLHGMEQQSELEMNLLEAVKNFATFGNCRAFMMQMR